MLAVNRSYIIYIHGLRQKFPAQSALHYNNMTPLLSVVVFTLLLREALSMAMLPGCADNVTRTPAVCCPVPAGHKHACGFPTRGICRRAQSYKEPLLNPLFTYQAMHDLRIHWPHRVFQYHCECLDKFWGQDCGECWFGYEGANCHHRVVFPRK